MSHDIIPIDLSPLPQPADDPRPTVERLRDYTTRGMASPESLNYDEIAQIGLALSLCLTIVGQVTNQRVDAA